MLGLPVCDGAIFDKGGLVGFRELLVEVILYFQGWASRGQDTLESSTHKNITQCHSASVHIRTRDRHRQRGEEGTQLPLACTKHDIHSLTQSKQDPDRKAARVRLRGIKAFHVHHKVETLFEIRAPDHVKLDLVEPLFAQVGKGLESAGIFVRQFDGVLELFGYEPGRAQQSQNSPHAAQISSRLPGSCLADKT